MRFYWLVYVIFIFFTACRQQPYAVYNSPNLGKEKVYEIAILPFKITSNVKANTKEISDYRKQEEDFGFLFQEKLSAYFFERKSDFSVKFQDKELTNQYLEKNNVNYKDLPNYQPSELAQLLDVDAVISGKVFVYKDINASEKVIGNAFWFGIIGGATTKIGETRCDIQLSSGKTDAVLWLYKKQFKKIAKMKSELFFEILEKEAFRKFPYQKDK